MYWVTGMVVSAWFTMSSAEIIVAYGGAQVLQSELVYKLVSTWDHCRLSSSVLEAS